MTKKQISKQLHLARVAANLTQAELAKKCNVSTPTIQSVEIEGKIETVKFKTLLAYCEAVGLSITITPNPIGEGIKEI